MKEKYEDLKSFIAFHFPGVYRAWIEALKVDEQLNILLKQK